MKSRTYTLPIRTVSESNAREHWATKAKRAHQHRGVARLACTNGAPLKPNDRVTVTLTRIAPRDLDDDNLIGSQKASRDGIADALGLKSDRDPRVTWVYGQRRGKPKEYAVVVEILYV